MLISRIIHQTAGEFAALPIEIRASIERMKSLNPGWDYRFYDDEAAIGFIGEHLGSDAVLLCERIDPKFRVMIADLFRYVAVHRLGGVYLDIKSTALRPLDEVLREDDVFLLAQWRNKLGEPFQGWGTWNDIPPLPGGYLQQWHVIAAAGHPFLARVIEDTLHNMVHYHPATFGTGKRAVEKVTGPICYTHAIAPMRLHYRARVVDIDTLGFRYTIYGDRKVHMDVPNHYSRAQGPIMRSEGNAAIPPIFRRPMPVMAASAGNNRSGA